ncbi:helix-turn-helix domain-containing protein [Microbacterium sp.]|uniref:helix-turn-helix domain-containing protein n=1 Tax=Microbacterium sp. TaxID=51671 RepID=UPI003F9CFB17
MQPGVYFRYSGRMDAPNYSTVDANFGERFLTARKLKGLSQEAVVTGLISRGLTMHVTAIGKIERGERRVTVGEASALASVLGYTLDGLIGGGADLMMAYVLSDRARDVYGRAWHDYLNALIDVAVAADEQNHPLREADRDWLTGSMPDQTPAKLLADALIAFDARLSRDGITSSKHVAVLREAIQRDTDAIEGLLVEESKSDG